MVQAWGISEQLVSKTEAADYGKTHFRGSQPPMLTLPVGIAVIAGTSLGQKGIVLPVGIAGPALAKKAHGVASRLTATKINVAKVAHWWSTS